MDVEIMGMVTIGGVALATRINSDRWEKHLIYQVCFKKNNIFVECRYKFDENFVLNKRLVASTTCFIRLIQASTWILMAPITSLES